jgi:hypothetical protein
MKVLLPHFEFQPRLLLFLFELAYPLDQCRPLNATEVPLSGQVSPLAVNGVRAARKNTMPNAMVEKEHLVNLQVHSLPEVFHL